MEDFGPATHILPNEDFGKDCREGVHLLKPNIPFSIERCDGKLNRKITSVNVPIPARIDVE